MSSSKPLNSRLDGDPIVCPRAMARSPPGSSSDSDSSRPSSASDASEGAVVEEISEGAELECEEVFIVNNRTSVAHRAVAGAPLCGKATPVNARMCVELPDGVRFCARCY